MTLIEQFEKEFGSRGYDLRRHHPEDIYADPITEGAWRGYETVRQHTEPTASVDRSEALKAISELRVLKEDHPSARYLDNAIELFQRHTQHGVGPSNRIKGHNAPQGEEVGKCIAELKGYDATDQEVEKPKSDDANMQAIHEAMGPIKAPQEWLDAIDRTLDYFSDEFPQTTERNRTVWASPVSSHVGGITPNMLFGLRNYVAATISSYGRGSTEAVAQKQSASEGEVAGAIPPSYSEKVSQVLPPTTQQQNHEASDYSVNAAPVMGETDESGAIKAAEGLGATPNPSLSSSEITLSDDSYAVVQLGPQRQRFCNGSFEMWTQRATRAGNRLIVDLEQRFHEGPGYERPKQYRFALMCVDTPAPKPVSVSLKTFVELFHKQFPIGDYTMTPSFEQKLFTKKIKAVLDAAGVAYVD